MNSYTNLITLDKGYQVTVTNQKSLLIVKVKTDKLSVIYLFSTLLSNSFAESCKISSHLSLIRIGPSFVPSNSTNCPFLVLTKATK